ncbi:MAG: hypothetical protein ACLU38_08725 [Dysosmobacter sp.]
MDTKWNKEKHSTYDFRQELVEKSQRTEKLRSRVEGRRVTWNELFDEAIGNYIECAERILAKVEKEEQGNDR